jgi:hypothetical protein
VPRQRSGPVREGHENRLGDIFREMHVSADAPQGRGINPIQLPLHQFRERLL